jgi:MFS family permease
VQANPSKQTLLWLSCFIVSLYYAYEMLQFALGSTLSTELVKTLHFSVYQLSLFSSAYLYACALGVLPAGLLLDRFAIKPLLLISLAFAILGIFILTITNNFTLIIIGRALTGFSSDFAFLGYLTLTTRYFKGKTEALAKSLIYSMGALGCILSQTPATLLMQHLGLHQLLNILVIVGLIIFLLIWTGVHNSKPISKNKPHNLLPLWQSLKLAALNKHNILAAYYACIANFPLMLLGALWSKIYLIKAQQLTPFQASNINSLIFWGAMLGSPLLGWLARFFQQHKMMITLALIGAGTWFLLALLPNNIYSLALLFILFGILVNSQLFSVIAVSKLSLKTIEATSLSMVSIANNAGGALYQLLFAWLLLVFRADSCHSETCYYSLLTFNYIFIFIALNYLLAAVSAYFIREHA